MTDLAGPYSTAKTAVGSGNGFGESFRRHFQIGNGSGESFPSHFRIGNGFGESFRGHFQIGNHTGFEARSETGYCREEDALTPDRKPKPRV